MGCLCSTSVDNILGQLCCGSQSRSSSINFVFFAQNKILDSKVCSFVKGHLKIKILLSCLLGVSSVGVLIAQGS